jgi:glycosyltransferase involved in cell wall biosynthesis
VITGIVTTFERRESCSLLISSARAYAPDVRLLVVDDSREPHEWPDADDRLILPYDSGLSAKRNAAVRHVGSGWVAILDDDFVFTAATDLARLVELAIQSGCDVMGGDVLNGGAPLRYHGNFEQTGNHVVAKQGWRSENGVNVCQLIPNFFVARAETLADHPWDDELKLAEHSAFFWRWRHDLKVGWTETVTIDHVQTRPEPYVPMRNRGYPMFVEWLRRNNLCWTDFYGTTIDQRR